MIISKSFSMQGDSYEQYQCFCLPDHLGSTSYITDRDDNATQFVYYKLYGEALVNEHNTSCEIF